MYRADERHAERKKDMNEASDKLKPVTVSTPSAGSAITDTERVNWLDAHPLPAEVRGGNDDGATAKFWGISAYDGRVREAIDHMIRTGSQRQKPVEYEP